MMHKILTDYITVTGGLLKIETSLSDAANTKEIQYVSSDSRDVRPGTLFICKGRGFDSKYLKAAEAAGAVAYVSEQIYDTELPCILVRDARKAMAICANLFYGNVWQRLHLIGITGTKGKTTTAYYIKYILDDMLAAEGRLPCGILSTNDNFDGVAFEKSHLTTPETLDLHKHFHNAAVSGLEFFVMEVSSQALKYGRTDGIEFEVAPFLNIGEDHISDIEHDSFEDYFSSKLKIFSQCKTAVINAGTTERDRVLAAATAASNIIIYDAAPDTVCPAKQPGNIRRIFATNIIASEGSVSFDTNIYDEGFRLSMPGLFNVENALAAISVASVFDVPEKHIRNGLLNARVDGRMEVFAAAGKTVLVDYAHNKLSFEILFSSLSQEYPDKKITLVFGCPGGKAFGRRTELGTIAAKYASRIILTEEDPGMEAVGDISTDIASHIRSACGAEPELIDDREAAIAAAIDGADSETLVVITGKGREPFQKRNGNYEPYPSDVELTEKYLGL